jgi:hypothetical protein
MHTDPRMGAPKGPDEGGGRTIYPLFVIGLAGTALVLQIASTRSFFVVKGAQA